MRGVVVPTQRFLAFVACIALVIGSLGPWRTSLSGAESGLDGSGIYTLLMAVMVALLLIPRRPWPMFAFALALICSVIAVVNVVDIARMTREPIGGQPPSVEVDWGLLLAALSSLALAVTTRLFGREVGGRPARPLRSHGRLEQWIRANPAIFGLLVLLGVGLVLRIWLTLAWSPAFTGYSDSGIYFQGAFESVWSDPIRMVGYSMFLQAVHAVIPHLIAVVVLQHAMGLAAAALMFFTVRRCGGPRWLGLAPAAVIALGGDELFFEHSALSDALFIFLIVATLYATVRASEDRTWWGAVAGLCAGLAVWDRSVGLGLVAIVPVWLVFSFGRPTRHMLVVGALSLVVALATVGVYAAWRSTATDLPGTLTSNSAWNLYGRVAPWADCSKFKPPPGTEELCEKTPPSQRGYRSSEDYIYNTESPAQRLFGPPYLVSSYPHAMERLREWSEAAIRGQPLDYLNAVWLDTRRLFSPNASSYGDLSADQLIAYLLYGADRSGSNEFVEYWQSKLYPHDPQPHHGGVGAFKVWEAITRIVNFWMALLLALCLAGPWVLSGRARAGMILFSATALMLLLFPIVSKAYDYRFVVPAFAPLVAAGVLAAWGLTRAAIARLKQIQKRTEDRSWRPPAAEQAPPSTVA
jgi:hypothetical protein